MFIFQIFDIIIYLLNLIPFQYKLLYIRNANILVILKYVFIKINIFYLYFLNKIYLSLNHTTFMPNENLGELFLTE